MARGDPGELPEAEAYLGEIRTAEGESLLPFLLFKCLIAKAVRSEQPVLT